MRYARTTALMRNAIAPFPVDVRFTASQRFVEAHVDRLLASIPEAGKMLSVGRSTIYRLIWDGKLEVTKIGRRTLIRIASIRRLAGEGERHS